MDNRRILRHGVSTRRAVQRNRQHGRSGLLDKDRTTGSCNIAEPCRRTRQLVGKGQCAIAARPGQSASRVESICIIARTAGVATSQRVVVQQDNCVGPDNGSVIENIDSQCGVRHVPVAIGDRVGKHILHIAWRAIIARIAVAAARIHRQDTISASR